MYGTTLELPARHLDLPLIVDASADGKLSADERSTIPQVAAGPGLTISEVDATAPLSYG